MARIDRYIELFNRQIAASENDDPEWRSRTLLAVIDNALNDLARRCARGSTSSRKFLS